MNRIQLSQVVRSVAFILCSAAVVCFGEESFLMDGPREEIVEKKKVEVNIKIVYGHGTGETKEAAEKDACRNAIEFAVGTFIDSETLIQNEKLIQDQILSHSNGYIEKYEVTGASRSTKGLGIEVDIKAWVKIQEAKKKVRDLVPGDTKSAEGLSDILGVGSADGSRSSRDKSAAALLKKELESFDPVRQLVNIRLISNKPTMLTEKEVKEYYPKEELGEGEVYLRYYCQFYVMQDVYFKRFMPRFTQILEQISVHEPVTFRPNAQRIGDWWSRGWHNDDWIIRAFFGGKSTYHNSPLEINETPYLGWFSEHRHKCPYLKNCFFLSNYRQALEDVCNKNDTDGLTVGTKLGHVDVVTQCNTSLTSIKGKAYFLAPAANQVLQNWLMSYFYPAKGYGDRYTAGAIDYLLRLLDAEGEEIAVKKESIVPAAIFLLHARSKDDAAARFPQIESSFVWGPWLNVAQDKYHNDKPLSVHISKIFPIDIRLSAEDAKMVKKVSISLAEAVE